MTDRHDTGRFRQLGVAGFFLAMMFLLGAPLLLWSWNTLAAGLFKLSDMQFKHALALEVFLGVTFLISGVASRLLISDPRSIKKGLST